MVYALLGNPNSGKTSLFNVLCKTGVSHENLPISYQEGKIKGTPHTLLDLPGLYSLKAMTEEEGGVIEHLRESPPDAILNVVDLTSPKKDLYLTLSLLSLRLPTVLVLTKADIGKKKYKSLHIRELEECLGVPVVTTCAPKKEGLETLIGALLHPKRPNRLPLSVPSPPVFYPPLLSALSSNPNPRLSLLLEEFLLSETPSLYTVNELKKNLFPPISPPTSEKTETLIVFRIKACTLLAERVFPSLQKEKKRAWGDRLFLSGALAPFFPFLALLMVLFLSLGHISSMLSHSLGLLIHRLAEQLLIFLQNGNTAPPLVSFITNGLLRGVGSVLSLLPIVWIFSFLVSLSLESGYTARVSCLYQNPFKEKRNSREFLSFLLLFASLFPKSAPFFCLVCYLLLYAVTFFFSFVTRIFIKTSPRQEERYIILVPFRVPFFKKCLREAFLNTANLIKRCFSIVFLCSAAIWLLFSVNPSFTYTADKNESLLALVCSSFLPLFSPLGITDWRILAGLFIAPFTKEGSIAALTVLSFGNSEGIASLFVKANAFSFLLFVLLFPPYSSTVSLGQKSNSLFLSLLIFLIRLFITFLLSSLVFLLVSHL